jgi:hypothetical protein
MNERDELRAMATEVTSGVDCVPPISFMKPGRQAEILQRLAKFVLEITAPLSHAVRPDRDRRCYDSGTRDAIFVFQAGRYIYTGTPDGYYHDGEGYIRGEPDAQGCYRPAEDAEDEAYLTNAQLAQMETDEGVPCALQIWETEAVYLSREEGEAYGNSRAYNYPDGWRVYCVPANGELGQLLRLGDRLWPGMTPTEPTVP